MKMIKTAGHCQKARHITRKGAKAARTKMIRKVRGLTKSGMSVYFCEPCKCWHIGRRREHDREYTASRRKNRED